MEQKELIDLYLLLVDKKNLIDKEIKEVRSKLQLDKGIYDGLKYKIEVSEVPSYSYDKDKIYKKLGKENFIQCSTLSKKELSNFLSESELNKFIDDVKISIRYSKYNEERALKYKKEGV